MPRTKRNIRAKNSRSSSSSQGPSIIDLYGRADPSESEALVDGPSSSLSGDKSASTTSPIQQNEELSSEESDAGWSEGNDMSSELGFSLSLSSSGNTNDEEGTITTRGTSVNREHSDSRDRSCLDNEEEDDSIGFHSENGSSSGHYSENSSSSSDGSSTGSRTSSGRSESADESSSSSDEHSDGSDDNSQHRQELEDQEQSKDDMFFASEFTDVQDSQPGESQLDADPPKVRLFSTVDDFMDRERTRVARRFSLNDRAVFRVIDGNKDMIDCAASDPGWGHAQAEDVERDRCHSLSPKNYHNSFVDDEFEQLGWLDDDSGGQRGQRKDSEVPRVVSADSSDNEEVDYGYGYDDELRDHTRNYDSRYDRDLSELVSSQTDRHSHGDDYDSDEDSEDNNTYLNRSVASYISADNSSRSQPDPFLRPDVGDRPLTPPSPSKRSPQKREINGDVANGTLDEADDYHGLPMSPDLEYKKDGYSPSSGTRSSIYDDHPQEDHMIDGFNDELRPEHEFEQNGDTFLADNYFPDGLPQIDENNPVHYDHHRNVGKYDQHETSEIPFGVPNNDALVKKSRRDRKLIVVLAAGLGCALLALAAVLGGVVAAAVLREQPVKIVEAPSPSSLSSNVPVTPTSQSEQTIPTKQPSKQQTRQPMTLAPLSVAPTPSPSKAPVSQQPTRRPVKLTPSPTITETFAPTSQTTFGFGAPPRPTPPPTEFLGFGVAKIP